MSLGNNASLNGFIPFPSTTAWNTNIASAPVDPNSAAIVAAAGFAGNHLHPDFGSESYYGIPYVVVDSTMTPAVPIAVIDYSSESDVVVAPYPISAPIEGAPADCSGWPDAYWGDAHVLVLDRAKCMLYETFNTNRCGGLWNSSSETIWDMTNYESRPYGWTSADAAGLSIFPGLVRYDEVLAGAIHHAIRFTLPHTKNDANDGYFVNPATHAAGTDWGVSNIMGMRIRLNASFDISGFSAVNQVILTAMKQYGLILADNGSYFFFQGASDPRWNDDDLSNLESVGSENFEVVQMTPEFPGEDSATAPTGASPTINSFSASASSVSSGSPVTFTYSVSGDSYDYIDMIGPVTAGSGSVTIHPTATQTFTLNSTNANGRTTSTPITVTVPGSVVAPPVFTPPAGTYSSGETAPVVTISTTTSPSATIYYTTNGSTPTTGSAVFSLSNPITVAPSETLKAIAVVSGYSTPSAVGSATYTAVASPLNQAIAFGVVPNLPLGTAPFTISASAMIYPTPSSTGPTSSGLTVSFASTTPSVCTVSGTTVTLAATGTCTIQATQAGNGTYAAAAPVNQSFQVTSSASAPAISSLSPPSAGSGGAGFTLTLDGANFVSGAVVEWNGTALSTTFVSGAQLTASVPAALIDLAGTASVTAVNPSGATSVAATFTITAPPTVHIDAPTTGATVSGIVTVAGWAIDNVSAIGTAINTLQVQVDGTLEGTATYGVSRPDVCSAYPGRPGCPNVGYTYSLNAATLTAGSHIITVSATDTDLSPDTGTSSVTVTVSSSSVPSGPPSVHIDAPGPGATVSGTVTVSGWAIDNATAVGTAISAVHVLLDGVTVGTAAYGTSRPDVCSAYPGRPGCPNVGYTYSLNTATLTAGSHTITVSGTDTDVSPDTGTSSVTVTVSGSSVPGGPPSVHIDAPASGSTISGTVTVSGWAIDNATAVGTAISSVHVLVDGMTAGTATCGVSRPDVCSAYPGRPGCPNVGYTYSLNTAALTAGSHTITVSATDTDAAPDTGTSSATISVSGSSVPSGPPTVHIDTPAPSATVSGTVTVSGWAIDNATAVGTAISSVHVLVDGVTVGSATYGVSRPDVCSAYPGRPSCPNVGYTYSLNTSALTTGSHTITVSATDTDGTPDTGSSSITVTVSASAAVIPTVHIDAPAPGATISGAVTVSGWAINNASTIGPAISSVHVLVDGVTTGTATYGVSRTDVCAAYPSRVGCPNVGYTYSLNTATLASGPHTIAILATDSASPADTGSTTITVVK